MLFSLKLQVFFSILQGFSQITTVLLLGLDEILSSQIKNLSVFESNALLGHGSDLLQIDIASLETRVKATVQQRFDILQFLIIAVLISVCHYPELPTVPLYKDHIAYLDSGSRLTADNRYVVFCNNVLSFLIVYVYLYKYCKIITSPSK